MKPMLLLLLIPSFCESQSIDIEIRFDLSSPPGKNFYVANEMTLTRDTIRMPTTGNHMVYKADVPHAGIISFLIEDFGPVKYWLDGKTSSFTITDTLIRGRRQLIIENIHGSEDSKLYNMQDVLMSRPGRKTFPFDSSSDERKTFWRNHAYELIDSLFASNPGSPVLPAYINRYASMFGRDTVAFFYDRLNESAKVTHDGESLKKFLDRSLLFRTGAVLDDITMMDNRGKLFKLSEINAKYILLDFWASWCVPCRADNPYLVDAYRKLRDKGLEIVSVSLDTDKNSWVKAIEKDGLPWHHISELKGRDSEIVKQYKIGPIPYAVLLDGHRKVIATRIRSNEVEKKIMSLLDSAGTQRTQ